jgi:class 3 adenylate cyclase
MSRLRRKPISQPDETREIPGGVLMLYDLADGRVGYSSFEPGWRWSTHVKPTAGTDYCEFNHLGYSVSGRVHVQHRDGAEIEIGPEQFYEIPAYHDAWVVGDEPWISIDWGSGMSFGQVAGTALERRVATILFTDIVDSTVTARRLGDTRWRGLLVDHNKIVRALLERYAGREIHTTGDGFLTLFDGAERAVHAALAMVAAVPRLGIQIRAGVHTGEIELEGSDVRGLSVHVAARIVALAGPGEVLVSWTTRELLSTSALAFEDRGQHELKGLPGPRAVYAARPI